MRTRGLREDESPGSQGGDTGSNPVGGASRKTCSEASDSLRGFSRFRSVPSDVLSGPTVRCVLDSLAARYASTVRRAADLTSRRVDVLHVVGGGSKKSVTSPLTVTAMLTTPSTTRRGRRASTRSPTSSGAGSRDAAVLVLSHATTSSAEPERTIPNAGRGVRRSPI